MQFSTKPTPRNTITIEPGTFEGRPYIKNSAHEIFDVLGLMEQGMSPDQILGEYPQLTRRDIDSLLRFSREVAKRMNRP